MPSGDVVAQGAKPGKVGLALQSLTPEIAQSLGLPADTQGVVIADVLAGSPAARAGLQSGEVIAEVDRKPVTSAEQAVAALKDGGAHLLRVRGPGGTRFVTVKPG